MAKNTVKIKKYADIIEELIAAGTITPGMLVELTSAGAVQAHSTAGGNQIPMFAVEDELQGKGITDDYVITDPVQVWVAGRGDIVYALLADGETAVIGSLLESNAAGALQVHVADNSAAANVTNQIVGQAIEALDLSGSANLTALGRIMVRIF